MASEYRSGQSSIIPAMFIGIGGVGSRIVDRIASRASSLPNWESQLRDLTSFVSIDTNELDQHRLRHVPDGNRLNIAAFDKAKAIEYFRRSQDPQALHWLDPSYQPRPGYKPGAGQIRVESRLGFFFHSPEIRQRLRELVADALRPGNVWRQRTPPKFNVYVFCTLAGGTGSGAFLSLAYLVDALIREQNWQPRVIGNLLLSTLMVDTVGPELHADIHANTYAALKELEHLTKLDYPQVKQGGRAREAFVYFRDENSRKVEEVESRPFFISFLFDRPPHLGLPEPELAIGDAAFLQVFTPIIDNLASELDNYEKNLEGLTRFPGELKHVGQGYSKNFGSFGAVALVLPGHDLLEYSALRFAAQATRGQITFGIDPSDPSDDRARALARLAVDYSDPKFLNLSDEGREQVINRAFVASVQEMARQDARQELTQGYWYQLCESVDEGAITGHDEKGQPTRGESLVARVERSLAEERQELLNKVSIKVRAFTFHREGVNQYPELVSRLADDIRAGRQIVDEGGRGLAAAASEGEAIAALKLDPIAERYLLVRLLDRLEITSIPEAQHQLEEARKQDISNPAVSDHLERELYDSLREAAATRRPFWLFWRSRDQEFYAVRDEAEEYYRKVAAAAVKTFNADVRLRQLRALLTYLKRRSTQYTRLATRMDSLVEEVEREAERLRRRETAVVPPLALRVEVFETLDEPRRRLWDQVYRALFLDGGRYLATFDRESLAATIAQELKPVVRADGTVAEKSLEQTVGDLRRALLALGRERLAPALFGDGDRSGLDLVRGLELEAQLVLGRGKRASEEVSDEEIDAYREKKFRAVAQMAGVLARVKSAEARALDDGVKVNRTRQLIVGAPDARAAKASERFIEQLKGVLGTGGRQVKTDFWHDPRLLIVHDVQLPIPLYYFEPVNGEIETAYLAVGADATRAYKLHTDFRWEESLPNLNPRRSELTVGWSLKTLAEGLVTRVIGYHDGAWVWHLDGEGRVEPLGQDLSSTLYRIGEVHQIEDLRQVLERRLKEAREALGPEAQAERRRRLAEQFEKLLGEIGLRKLRGEMSREDHLDQPILELLRNGLAAGSSSPAPAGDQLYTGLDLV
jgi:Tubulin like